MSNSDKKQTILFFGKLILIFIGLMIMFLVYMVLGCLFSSKLIEKNVMRSSNILYKQTSDFQPFDFYVYGFIDNYTDILMVNEAYSVDSKKPLYSAMTVRKNYNREITKHEMSDMNGELKSIGQKKYGPHLELKNFLDGKIDTSVLYARYWHGYLPILRLLLIVFNVSQIRILFFIIFILLFILVFWKMKKILGLKSASIFSFSLLGIGYFFVSYSLQGLSLFIIMMLSVLWLLRKIENISSSLFYTFIFIVGCVVNFFDYLTVPLIVLGVFLYVYVVYFKEKKNVCNKVLVKRIFLISILYMSGYILTWLFKWVLFDILYHKNLLSVAINQIFYRSSGNTDFASKMKCDIFVLIVFLLLVNLVISGVYLFLFCLIFRKRLVFKYSSFREYVRDNYIYLFILLFPFMWYLLVRNHSLLHWFFTCRNMLIFLVCFLHLIVSMFSIKNKS